MVFLGNPGTGKTTVARLIGEMFRKMGVLSTGQFLETDATGLIAGYTGQTRIQTEAILREALGGVLFIDEAYSMVDPDNPSASTFGKDALGVLVKEMEDHRDNLCVILAGYTKEMNGLMRTNPGLESRIAFTLNFDDYKPSELHRIIIHMSRSRNYQFTEDADQYLHRLFTGVSPHTGKLGNGRFARNVLEAAIRRQSRRLADAANNSTDALRTLTVSDVQAWEEENKTHDTIKSST